MQVTHIKASIQLKLQYSFLLYCDV